MSKIQLLIKKNYGHKQLLLLNIANKTVEACPEWVSAFQRLYPINHNVGPMYPLPPRINHYVGSAWLELVTNSLPCKI